MKITLNKSLKINGKIFGITKVLNKLIKNK